MRLIHFLSIFVVVSFSLSGFAQTSGGFVFMDISLVNVESLINDAVILNYKNEGVTIQASSLSEHSLGTLEINSKVVNNHSTQTLLLQAGVESAYVRDLEEGIDYCNVDLEKASPSKKWTVKAVHCSSRD